MLVYVAEAVIFMVMKFDDSALGRSIGFQDFHSTLMGRLYFH
jgi:hypothetical protein